MSRDMRNQFSTSTRLESNPGSPLQTFDRSAATINLVKQWEDMDLPNFVNKLSTRIALKADAGKVEGLAQMLNVLERDMRKQFATIPPPDRMEQTLDPSRLSSPRSGAMNAINVDISTVASGHLRLVVMWFRRLIEVLVGATNPSLSSNATNPSLRSNARREDVSLFDRTTHQALIDFLEFCIPPQDGQDVAALPGIQSPGRMHQGSHPRIDFVERKLTEVNNTLALKADVAEVDRLAGMIQTLSDGTFDRALQTQWKVTRPVSAPKVRALNTGRPNTFR